MKEQLITLDVAQLAKDKHFKEPCLAYFSLSGEPKYFREDGMYYYSIGENGRLILRPTQSLLQKWLREEHKLSIEVYYFKGWDYDICFMETNTNTSGKVDLGYYEEALELGLLEALKLIS